MIELTLKRKVLLPTKIDVEDILINIENSFKTKKRFSQF